MINKRILSPIALVLAALIWGFAFIAQKEGLNTLGPFMITALRSILGGIALLPLIFFMSKFKKDIGPKNNNTKKLILGGVACGTVLYMATAFQQIGLIGTDAGKSGFITAMYIVLVPVFSIFLKQKTTLKTWVAIVLAIVGLYLLCVKENFSVEISDLLTLCCAVVFAVHILVIDHFSPLVDGVKMSCIQFFVCGILSLLTSIILGEPCTLAGILGAKYSILYLGLFSSGAGYTLQIVAQKNVNPTLASMLMSLESVFALLAGALFGETLGLKEGIGCIIMFAAVILAQLPERKKSSI